MPDLSTVIDALKQRATTLQTELIRVQGAIKSLEAGSATTETIGRRGRPPQEVSSQVADVPKGKRKLSKAGRAAIGAAAKKRWAAYRKAQKKVGK